jgi:DNA repair photolyase
MGQAQYAVAIKTIGRQLVDTGQTITGRGAQFNPANRFERITLEDDWEHLQDDDTVGAPSRPRTEYFVDESRSILSENDSPDIPFRYSLNPYRGCAHGCAYCYARPTHEYFGLSAGLDFETKIFVKLRAPELLREQLCRPDWQPEPIMFSGATDCYQPIERTLQLTRRCLQVALEACQPVSIVTKNALIERDLDVLVPMAQMRLVRVAISVTSLDQSLTRDLEPRTASPAARLRVMEKLSHSGIPVTVMVAPVIPGLNDMEVPRILKAAAEHGAQAAAYVLLRLPLTVAPVFLDWLGRKRPLLKDRVESRIRATHGGQLNCAQFGERMRGSGLLAEQIRQTFQVFARRYGLDRRLPPLDVSQFRPPRACNGQLWLW